MHIDLLHFLYLSQVSVVLISVFILYWLAFSHVSVRTDKRNCHAAAEQPDNTEHDVSSYNVYYSEDENDDWTFEAKPIDEYRNIYENQFLKFPNLQNADKYLVYACELTCGGLADRLKGIFQVYMLSIIAKRKFGIYWNNSCELQVALEPNLLDWRFDFAKAKESQLSMKSLSYRSAYQPLKYKYETEDLDPMTVFKEDVILLHSNQDWTTTFRRLSVTAERFREIYQHSSSDLSRIIFHGLFKYSTTLQVSVDDFFNTHVGNNKLACFHARMGDYNETARYQMSDLDTVFDFLQTFITSRNYKIMVASDKQEVKQKARDRFPGDFVDTSGPIIHIDQDRQGQECTGFIRAFLDLTVLSRCDTLVLTNSGFGMMAATLRSTSRDLYSFFRTHGVFPVSRENSKKMYQYRCTGSDPAHLDICPP